MRQRNTLALIFIGILVALCAATLLVHDLRLSLGPLQFEREGMRLGLDLQGGTRLVLQANLSGVPDNERADRMQGVKNVIERRINAFGVAEPIVQILGQDRVLVELAGIRDIEQAKQLIGNTARLDFREQVQNPDGTTDWVVAQARDSSGELRELTGQYFKKAEVGFEPNTNRPLILFEFNDEGARMFAEITTRLVGKPLGIFLDNQLLTAPVVREPITQGRGQITGNFTLQEARNLVIQLNAGALPVPVTVIEERTVDATLGSDSVRKSIVAGAIGLAAVAVFMIALYRVPGGMAVLALGVYALLSLAIFKLWPVTLTLAGIAGFILSIGMAVDANILVFERLREELRLGKSVRSAMEAGFDRAWSSIRDSNVSTLITCAILIWFGSNFGASIIVGFAVTLAIGVLVSLFSAIFVTRTFLRALTRLEAANRPEMFGVPATAVPAAAAGSTPVAAPGVGR
ncbi:MAG TPA: protein translocase subunit SecD [Chloroflexota bacterium]|nr:protein translocase subunit SecD [Chloroflexota bacterium]